MDAAEALVWQGLQIVWINLLLSGDNAVVIALACRDLDPRTRRRAALAGSAVAVLLRIIFSLFIVALQRWPYVKLGSGLLLFWIAFGLLRGHQTKNVRAAPSLWHAVRVIALADAIMSLDNVVAVASAAKDSLPLIAFGIAFSVPIIVFGSNIVIKLLTRFPILVFAGAMLLGWVAGEIIATDPILRVWFPALPSNLDLYAGGAGALIIVAFAGFRYVTHRGLPRKSEALSR
jgi:YjbE family integral membrane protein